MVCGGVWWFAVVCGGLRWFVVVCGGLWWFAVDCSGLSFSHTVGTHWHWASGSNWAEVYSAKLPLSRNLALVLV